jgi:exopolysaccharide biosynthesis protein
VIALLLAALLPAHVQPAAPFPHIVTEAPTIVQVAPGVAYGAYDFMTSEGPIAAHVLAIAPDSDEIALGTALADGELTSPGETLSSMARRTGAIGGINGDYFDIGNTNRPTNIVVQHGSLVHTPRKRYALIVTNDGRPHIAESAFAGSVTLGGRSLALDAVNEVPAPNGGLSLVTPAFGPVPANNDLTLVALAPASGTPPFAHYTVTSIADNTVTQPRGYYLAIGLDAYAHAGVPNPGDPVDITGDLSPYPLASVRAAVGGGPLLLDDGAPVQDPDGPNGAEFAKRIPESGAAITADGTLLLVEVDGREPEHSVGVTRPEYTALLQAFGAERALAFDGGGSSDLVARMPTRNGATPASTPSDGRERKIADALLVYDTATPGPATQLVALPEYVRALPGARVPIRVAAADAHDRVASDPAAIAASVDPPDLGTLDGDTFVAAHPGTGSIVLRSGALASSIPVDVQRSPARIALLPPSPSAPENGTLEMRARAFDAQGYPLALPAELPWRALHATIDPSGLLHAGSADALVSLLLGDRLANVTVSVGYHEIPLEVTAPRAMTLPHGGDAAVSMGTPCPACLQLSYALGTGERAAYLVVDTPLPAHSVAIAFDLDASGAPGAFVKLALRNAIDEEVLLPAVRITRAGREHVEVRLPEGLAQPARLVAVYVIARSASQRIRGTIAVSALRAVAAGSANPAP